ncbi:MAG: polyribonucleotide nucleotidyltransferase [Myxococcales bacterium]|nr:polyribonucleotide nucleotidyltransferase [Myxococcota bacterium]MDW8283210.1 polyribonucleotide nucleotidyltransferase [Myxococcales bacterium]
MYIKESVTLGGRELVIETGKMAKQADGAVVVRYGDSMVLVTAVASKTQREGIDFLPLTCEFIEKTYGGGKIPGGYFKREGRPTEAEILTSRLIDRPVRPLFPKGWRFESQIIAMTLSFDKENPTDVLAMTGASAALHLSNIPWAGPFAGLRVGRIDGQFVVNPTFSQREQSDMDIVVAASRDAIVMVEGGADQISEEALVDALMFAHQSAQVVLDLIEKLRGAAGKEKRVFVPPPKDEVLAARVAELGRERMRAAVTIRDKHSRHESEAAVEREIVAELCTGEGAPYAGREKEVIAAVQSLHKKIVRDMILDEQVRIDGRRTTDIRPISCEVGLLPRVHGSGLFTRGETQGLVTVTLGTKQDEQRIDSLLGEIFKRFMLHYNFPPFCTGEVKPLRGQSRREVGHGALAERALLRVMPKEEEFPYVVRVVSEILESNGSSSMATVCGGSLALMDAGVPIKAPVSGIAMGLIYERMPDGTERTAILSDILGDEDHLGDMDFKVCGTRFGITAVQMDIKIQGLSRELLYRALLQARDGRLYILDKMAQALSAPRTELSRYAPRIYTINVKPDRIRDIIGPGGKTIRAIIEQTGVSIDVSDDGTVSIASPDGPSAQQAMDIIKGLTAEPEVGNYYMGTVRRIVEFGAFVEILPGTDGLIHISELSNERVNNVSDVLREGDEVLVKVISIDRMGKIRLSRKEALGQKPDVIHNLRQ